jgi:uncharacterized protein
MGEVESYPHGTFCWVDLGTTDLAGAKEFYGRLLGWEMSEAEAGEAVYTMATIGGKPVSGMHEHAEADAPPSHWDAYVAVDDLDAAAGRVRELGGAVAIEPFEITDGLRMAVAEDPTGARLCLWQNGPRTGAGLVNETGTWTWCDLSTRDLRLAAAFYGDLFGWRFREAIPSYGTFSMGELLIGGMRAMEAGEEGPPNWFPYFVVEDADRASDRVQELGGRVLVPPREVPAGRFLVMQDPSGAVGGLIEMGPEGPAGGVDRVKGQIRPTG